MPPRQALGFSRDVEDPLGRFEIPGRERPRATGPARWLRVAATVAAVGAALLLAPRLVGTGARPRLLDGPGTTAAGTTEAGQHAGSVRAGPMVSHSDLMQILDVVNATRRSSGCGGLVLDPRLRRAATEHTADMAATGRLSHTGSDGSTPTQRAAAHGYPGPVGENIARGYDSTLTVMQAWLASEGHHANIVNCDFHSLGVGHLADGGWWTMVFGA
jgi:uncharacterized protein YkwD